MFVFMYDHIAHSKRLIEGFKEQSIILLKLMAIFIAVEIIFQQFGEKEFLTHW